MRKEDQKWATANYIRLAAPKAFEPDKDVSWHWKRLAAEAAGLRDYMTCNKRKTRWMIQQELNRPQYIILRVKMGHKPRI